MSKEKKKSSKHINKNKTESSIENLLLENFFFFEKSTDEKIVLFELINL